LSSNAAGAPHPDSGFSPVERCGSFEGLTAELGSPANPRAFMFLKRRKRGEMHALDDLERFIEALVVHNE
jgi:hypothetical protein